MTSKPRQNKGRIEFVVSFVLPEGATQEAARQYVEDAVASWHGSLRPPGGYSDNDPGDPMFLLDSDTVEAKRHWKPRRPA